MKGEKNRVYLAGCTLMLFGGCGLAEISTSNHGSFILCATLFSIGIGLCLWSYSK